LEALPRVIINDNRGMMDMMRFDTMWTAGLVALGLLISTVSSTAQPVVDGQTDDADYIQLGTATGDAGYGEDVGIKSMSSFATADSLYIAIEGKIDVTGGDFREYVVFINAETPTGIPSGTALPPGSDGLSPFSQLDGMILDAEVDYGIRFTGGNSDNGFVSIVDYVSFSSGDTDASDSFEATLSADGSVSTGGTSQGSYAYLDAADLSSVSASGFELAIPLSFIGASAGDTFQLFAFHGQVENDQVGAHLIPDDGVDTQYSNSVDWTAVSGIQFTSPSILPVELAAFDALADGRTAVLTWSTLSETNNDRFVVEHAAPGAGFSPAGSVEGNGTTTQRSAYRFELADLEPGTHRFRLRQYDIDGANELSEAISLNIGVDGLAVSGAAPHPVQGESAVNISVDSASPVRVELFNLLGQRVRTLFDGTVTSGRAERVAIRGADLPSGTYFVRTTADAGSDVQRITIVR
jgi:hypothetical protein